MRMVRAGLHSFLKMSKQIAPVSLLMFGCQILVSYFIWGGQEGRDAESGRRGHSLVPGPWPAADDPPAASCASQHRSAHGYHSGESAQVCATLRTPLDTQALKGLRACAPWAAQKGSRPEAECRF